MITLKKVAALAAATAVMAGIGVIAAAQPVMADQACGGNGYTQFQRSDRVDGGGIGAILQLRIGGGRFVAFSTDRRDGDRGNRGYADRGDRQTGNFARADRNQPWHGDRH